MKSIALTPRPWWQIGLAVLPGVVYLALVFAGDSLAVLFLVTVVGLVVAALWAMLRWHLPGLPIWSYLPLGLVAFIVIEPVAMKGMALWSGWAPGSVISSSLVGLLAALALASTAAFFLSKDSDLCAGLFVLTVGVLIMSMLIEQTIYFHDNPTWNAVTRLSEAGLFFIASPLWVMRSRTLGGQAAGLVLPVGAYGVILARVGGGAPVLAGAVADDC